MNESSTESKGRSNLFGALSNPYSKDTLDMVLSLPDISHDSLSLKSNSVCNFHFVELTHNLSLSYNT